MGKCPPIRSSELEEILIPTLNPEIYRREGVIFTEVPKKYPQHYDKYLTIRLGAKRGPRTRKSISKKISDIIKDAKIE